jgi:hypothetical protein
VCGDDDQHVEGGDGGYGVVGNLPARMLGRWFVNNLNHVGWIRFCFFVFLFYIYIYIYNDYVLLRFDFFLVGFKVGSPCGFPA